ncbi:hypothetical protein ABQX22_18340 [Xanthomonas sp. WHRI 1810A]|uniref:hypothetical protein n=1 Tax=Xanthomonas sp. WHRI 1810A TaxID=3161565 RepID=UPI0032E922A6
MTNINLKVAEKIASIARKPNLPPRALFILIQRCVRISLRHRALIWDERRVFRREAAKLKAYLPFAQLQMDKLIEKAKTHRAAEMEGIKQGLVGFGFSLIKDSDRAFETIGFEGICDLLSINPVHRLDALTCEEQSLAGLIYVGRLENSAGPKSEGWGEGGPLFEACFMAMMEWIQTAPEEDLPGLFGPHSPFAASPLAPFNAGTLQ